VRVHTEELVEEGRADREMFISGGEAEVAEEIRQVSAEGMPADARMGPGAIRWMLAGAWLVMAAAATVVGLMMNWLAGFVVLLIGSLSLLFNSAILAGSARIRERARIVEEHREREHPHAYKGEYKAEG
jgi:hypothetical protein